MIFALGRSWVVLGGLGAILGGLQAVLGHLGAVLGRLGAVLGRSCGGLGVDLGCLGVISGPKGQPRKKTQLRASQMQEKCQMQRASRSCSDRFILEAFLVRVHIHTRRLLGPKRSQKSHAL